MNFKANATVALAIGVTCVFCALCPITADAGESPWQVRISGLSMNPTGDTVLVPDTGEQIAFAGHLADPGFAGADRGKFGGHVKRVD